MGWSQGVDNRLDEIKTLTVLATALLALAPLSLIPSSSRILHVAQRLAAVMLLGVWLLPIVFYATPRPTGGIGSFTSLAWGYYVFASAYTMAFIAVQISPKFRPRPATNPGFPVICATPPGQTLSAGEGEADAGTSKRAG